MLTGEQRSSGRSDADTRLAWMIGGGLLLASPLSAMILQQLPSLPMTTGGTISRLLFAGALLVFAFGIRRSGSVTGLRPLGTTAIAILAVWTVLWPSVVGLLMTGDTPQPHWQYLSYIHPLVGFLTALIATTQIARAGVVPKRWRWAPLLTLAAVTTSWLIQALVVATTHTSSLQLYELLLALDSLTRTGATVFLGVLAIVLANRPRATRTVQVYRSTP